jgi:hypothetical protein
VSSRYAPGRNQASSLFGLAPCGVCHARGIAAAAVRSCRTFSPLPLRAVYFLWRFPSTGFETGCPDVIRHTALWSSDFPLAVLDVQRAVVRSSCLRFDYIRRTRRMGTRDAISAEGCAKLFWIIKTL